MRKIGVDDSEFTAPARRRAHPPLRRPHGHDSQNHTATTGLGGAKTARARPTEDQLSGHAGDPRTSTTWCSSRARPTGEPDASKPTAHQNVINYANAGGRIFATHFSYIWLYETRRSAAGAMGRRAAPVAGQPDRVHRHVLPQGAGARAVAPERRCLDDARADPAQSSVTTSTASNAALAVVDAPSTTTRTSRRRADALHVQHARCGAGAAQQCGRVLFDDFHVENTSSRRQRRDLPGRVRRRADDPAGEAARVHDLRPRLCVTPDVPRRARPRPAPRSASSAARPATAAAASSSAAPCPPARPAAAAASRASAARPRARRRPARSRASSAARPATAAATHSSAASAPPARPAAAAASRASAAPARAPRRRAPRKASVRPGRRRLRQPPRVRHLPARANLRRRRQARRLRRRRASRRRAPSSATTAARPATAAATSSTAAPAPPRRRAAAAGTAGVCGGNIPEVVGGAGSRPVTRGCVTVTGSSSRRTSRDQDKGQSPHQETPTVLDKHSESPAGTLGHVDNP